MFEYLYLYIIEKLPLLSSDDSLDLRFLYTSALPHGPLDFLETELTVTPAVFTESTISGSVRVKVQLIDDLSNLSCFIFSFLKDYISLHSKPANKSFLCGTLSSHLKGYSI